MSSMILGFVVQYHYEQGDFLSNTAAGSGCLRLSFISSFILQHWWKPPLALYTKRHICSLPQNQTSQTADQENWVRTQYGSVIPLNLKTNTNASSNILLNFILPSFIICISFCSSFLCSSLQGQESTGQLTWLCFLKDRPLQHCYCTLGKAWWQPLSKVFSFTTKTCTFFRAITNSLRNNWSWKSWQR